MTGVVEERAPAKVNLYLHVLSRRADGYHTLESLVAFAAFGDEVRIAPAPRLSVEVEGPFAGALRDLPQAENLAYRAAAALRDAIQQPDAGASIRILKRIPLAAGLGGGSADAAAVLRGLTRLWRAHVPAAELEALALRLGADVPVCLLSRPCLVTGVGEGLAPADGPYRERAAVLAHTGKALPTADVFRRLTVPPSPPAIAPGRDFFSRLKAARNDLEAPAFALQGEIAALLARLGAMPGCRLARMSGSGAATFALFDEGEQAEAAAERLTALGWWAIPTTILA